MFGRGLLFAMGPAWRCVVLSLALALSGCDRAAVDVPRGAGNGAADGAVVSVVRSALNPVVSTNSSNFNGTDIPAGRYLWFTSVMKVTGLGTEPVHLHFSQQHITFSAGGTPFDLTVPDSRVTIDPAAPLATTTFDSVANVWETTLDSSWSGNAFLSGLAYPVPSALPGGIDPVTWSGVFEADASGLTVKWVWAAAVYTTFSQDHGALLVKPIDGNSGSEYPNSDHAGTPEAYKAFVVGGARGGGGSNYTGSLSGTVSVTPALCTSVSDDDATCNGVDDNCNAVADEDYVPVTTSCGVGACVGTGTTSCASGAVLDDCVPGTPDADDATCDVVDDDCDGRVDEGFPVVGTQCGTGACASVGARTCVSGAQVDDCQPGDSGPSDESCDGVDQDCDGPLDEDYAPVASTCGVGPCAATGTTACVAGDVTDSCQPGTPAPSDTSCNAVDDDCDGAVDEGCESACGNGLDDDADGSSDCADGDCVESPSCLLGQPCAADADCAALGAGATCMTDLPAGYCVIPCDDLDPLAPCPDSGFCLSERNVCVLACDAPGACARAGQACLSLPDTASTLCRSGCEAGCQIGVCDSVTDTCTSCSELDVTCDGVDDDCDGAIDDDFEPVQGSCACPSL